MAWCKRCHNKRYLIEARGDFAVALPCHRCQEAPAPARREPPSQRRAAEGDWLADFWARHAARDHSEFQRRYDERRAYERGSRAPGAACPVCGGRGYTEVE